MHPEAYSMLSLFFIVCTLLCVSAQIGEEEVGHSAMPGRTIHSSLGLAEACRFVCNDAKFVNERARNDIILLSR